MTPEWQLRQSNPFSSRWVRPGRIPYFFRPGENPTELVERLRANRWRGQIIGPHGSGKSTLLAALLPMILRAGKKPYVVALHDGQRHLPRTTWREMRALEPAGNHLLVIDGYEQLGYGQRFWLGLFCRRCRHGLLVTTHVGLSLPVIYRTEVTLDLAHQVVDHLLKGRVPTIAAVEMDERLSARTGNLRETLFDLYDLHERRQPAGRNHL